MIVFSLIENEIGLLKNLREMTYIETIYVEEEYNAEAETENKMTHQIEHTKPRRIKPENNMRMTLIPSYLHQGPSKLLLWSEISDYKWLKPITPGSWIYMPLATAVIIETYLLIKRLKTLTL